MIKINFFPLMEEAGEQNGAGGGEHQLTAEEIAQRLQSPEGTEFEQSLPKDGDGTGDGDNSGTKTGDEFIPSEQWKIFSGMDGFEMPKDITKENEAEMMKPFAKKMFGIEDEQKVVLHPLTQKVNDMINSNPDITIGELAKQLSSNILDPKSMSLDEKINYYLLDQYGGKYDEQTNPNGLKDEDIEEYVSKLNTIDKKKIEKEVDIIIEKNNNELMDNYSKERDEQYEKAYNEYLTTIDTSLQKIKNSLSTTEEIYGVKVNSDTIDNYLDEFKEAVTLNKKTGERKIDELLSNDVDLFKFFVLLMQGGEDKVMEIITRGRETAKEDLFIKLGLTPNPEGSQSKSEGNLTLEEKRRRLSTAQK